MSTFRRLLRLWLSALFIVAVAGACAGVSATSDPRGASDPSRNLYILKCGSCHAPFPPHSYSDTGWPVALAKMASEAGLTSDERARILRWLKENN